MKKNVLIHEMLIVSLTTSTWVFAKFVDFENITPAILKKCSTYGGKERCIQDFGGET
jgi:hypothetical protein